MYVAFQFLDQIIFGDHHPCKKNNQITPLSS